MHILILGAAGMVGRKLTQQLLRDGRLGKQDITRMTLQDVIDKKQGTPVAENIRSLHFIYFSDLKGSTDQDGGEE